jgi:Raf kinase inhibitor-like YbhB/YbcL family protein
MLRAGLLLTSLLGVLLLCPACKKAERVNSSGENTMQINLSSPAITEGATIPKQYTGDGKDVSPPLHWGKAPQGTKSFALLCEDPDAPGGMWVHWVIFDIPAEAEGLDAAAPASETLPSGAKQGKNDFGKIGYGGPAPPRGKPHRYYFKLYALDSTLNLSPGSTRDQVLGAMKGHVLAAGELMGKYAR